MFDPLLADIRFGCGRSPRIAAPQTVWDMLGGLLGPDDVARALPIQSFEGYSERVADSYALGRIRIRQRGTPAAEEAMDGLRKINRTARRDQKGWLAAHIGQ